MPKPEVCRLQDIITAQTAALAYWRREADRDFGRLERYAAALRKIGFDPPLDDKARIAQEALIAEMLTL